MQWTREEYIELMTFGEVKRQMFVELFGPLVGLKDEWKAQGATDGELGMTAFDFDYVPIQFCGGESGVWGGFEKKVIEDTPEYTISIDKFGRTVKLAKGFATIPLPLDFPVKNMDDWLKIKHMFTFDEARIDWKQVEAAKEAQKNGTLILAYMQGGFDIPRELMGEEVACLAYYEQPELMEDILATVTDTAVRMYDRISDHVQIDDLFVHEDLAGKSGPLIGPNQVREFIMPYYRKVWDMLSSKGTKLFSQDSDGNVEAVLDVFMECGINITYPCEPAAGMDVVKLRQKYGNKLAFKGGIDKHVLRKSKLDILRELEYKLQPLMQQGGMVFGLDHLIPNGTPLENYRYYVQTAREILGLPTLDSSRTGWGKMAF